MINRITKRFLELKTSGRMAIMPFTVLGYPDNVQSLDILRTIAQEADMLEVGFPYSDPLADGPTIQLANQTALASGATVKKNFAIIKSLRRYSDIPITVLVYANLVEQMGIEEFYRHASSSGVDGVLIPDVPVEEIAPYARAARKHHIAQIFLIAPTTDAKRLRQIVARAEGFLYLVSVRGVTGRRTRLNPEVGPMISRVRRFTDMPICVGFGISDRAHCAALRDAGAEGAIVGSALIDVIHHARPERRQRAIERYLRGLFV